MPPSIEHKYLRYVKFFFDSCDAKDVRNESDFTRSCNADLISTRSLYLFDLYFFYHVESHLSLIKFIHAKTADITPRGANLCWALGGDNLQFYPNFALFSTLGGWTSTTIFSGKHIKWRSKKKVFTKIGSLFLPELKWRPDADPSQIIGGMQM